MTLTFNPDISGIPIPPGAPSRLHRILTRLANMITGESADASADIEQEFMALISCENANISKICFAYATTVDDFNDMRQDALINIWRGMKTFRGEASERTWIYRVTLNSCLSTIRSQKRHRHEDLSQLYALVTSDNDNREEIERMHLAISALGREDRAIILMWLDEIGYDDIASATGLNRNTIATRIRRIKEKIKKIYKKEEQL